MDPGQVVWLPGAGWDQSEENMACHMTYGYGYYACGDGPGDNGGTLVYCCFS
jgi:hypothetical protein